MATSSKAYDRKGLLGHVSLRYFNVVVYLNELKFEQTRDMECSVPDSETVNESGDSVAGFEDDFDIEVEDEDGEDERALYASRWESSDDIMANADEPLADEEWL